MSSTLIALVEDKPGVLNRVASLFRRRNFNIESLNVGRTEQDDISRMTIVIDNPEVDAHRVETNLYKLVNVLEVVDSEDVILITEKGVVLRQNIGKVNIIGRNTQGVKMMQVSTDDKISDVAKIVIEDEE